MSQLQGAPASVVNEFLNNLSNNVKMKQVTVTKGTEKTGPSIADMASDFYTKKIAQEAVMKAIKENPNSPEAKELTTWVDDITAAIAHAIEVKINAEAFNQTWEHIYDEKNKSFKFRTREKGLLWEPGQWGTFWEKLPMSEELIEETKGNAPKADIQLNMAKTILGYTFNASPEAKATSGARKLRVGGMTVHGLDIKLEDGNVVSISPEEYRNPDILKLLRITEMAEKMDNLLYFYHELTLKEGVTGKWAEETDLKAMILWMILNLARISELIVNKKLVLIDPVRDAIYEGDVNGRPTGNVGYVVNITSWRDLYKTIESYRDIYFFERDLLRQLDEKGEENKYAFIYYMLKNIEGAFEVKPSQVA